MQDLAGWLRSDGDLDGVRLAIDNAQTTARRFLPHGAAGRTAAANAIRIVIGLAADGVQSAEALLPYLPRVILGRGLPVSEQLERLVSSAPAKGVTTARERDSVSAYHARLWAALEAGDARALCALVDRGPTDGIVTEDEMQAVAAKKFPRKLEGETIVEQEWVDAMSEL
jgi:hypothetical protein